MSCIGTALEADNHITLFREQICDFAFSFIAPVCTNNCLYHTTETSSNVSIVACRACLKIIQHDTFCGKHARPSFLTEFCKVSAFLLLSFCQPDVD
jgi:hypothetical protein